MVEKEEEGRKIEENLSRGIFFRSSRKRTHQGDFLANGLAKAKKSVEYIKKKRGEKVRDDVFFVYRTALGFHYVSK